MTFITTTFGKVSTLNSSALALAIAGSYSGSYEVVKEFSNAAITIVLGSSESVTLSLDFSTDATGTNEITKTITFTDSYSYTVSMVSEYYRIRIDADQGTAANGFVQTVYNKTGQKAPFESLGTTLTNSDQSLVTSSLMYGTTGAGTYSPIQFSTSGDMKVGINSPLDAFSRLQVSNPFGLFDMTQLTTDDPLEFDTELTGGGTSSYTLGFPQSTLQVAANGDRVVRQQHGYSTYQAGKSLLILCTGCILESAVTNVRGRIGYFDDLNDKTVDDNPTGDGFFFQSVSGAMSVVYRTSNDSTIPPTTPPSQSDTTILQANWNKDPLDGTGPSGITIDFTKRQIFFISMEWLGVGDVLMGLFYNMRPLPCHQFNFTNGDFGSNPTIAYTCRGSLPIRYELEATGVPSGTATMRQVCGSVISEGGFQPFGTVYACERDTTESVGTGLEPIMSLRHNQTGTAPIRPRITINITKVFGVCTSGGNVIYKIFKFHNPTQFGAGPLSGGGGPSWINESTDPGILHSGAEYDITANSVDVTGVTYPYTLVEQGFFSNNRDFFQTDLEGRLTLNSDIAGESDWLVVAMETLGGTETLSATIQFQVYE